MKCDQGWNSRTLQPVSPRKGKPEFPEMCSEDIEAEVYEPQARKEIGAVEDDDDAEDSDDHDSAGTTPKVLRDV